MKTIATACLSVCFFVCCLSGIAFGYEREIESLASAMSEKIANSGKTKIAVVDFTDLRGDVTELGRFISEELSVSLAGLGKGFKIVDRTHLKSIIQEHKLSTTGLIDPTTARKLGEIAGVEALVTGSLTPFGDTVRITVKVLDTETAEIIDAKKESIAKTEIIDELLMVRVEPQSSYGPTNLDSHTHQQENANHKLAGTWQGYWKNRKNTMVFNIENTDENGSFNGFINWPTYRNTTTKIRGQVVNDFGDFLEQSKWRFVKDYETDKSGIWIKFTEYEFLQGNGVALDGWYYAKIDIGKKEIVGMYFRNGESNPDGNIELTQKNDSN